MPSIDRRDFLKGGAGAAIALSGIAPGFLSGKDDRTVQVGIIGVGGRGRSLLRLLLRRQDTLVNAICDINPAAIQKSLEMTAEAGVAAPAQYQDGEEDFRNLLVRDDLDAVIVATPWLWHTTMATAAMKAGKAVGVEVPAAITVEECWDLVDTSEQTGMPCMILENVCYRRDVMTVLNMVRQGLFGELIHCQGGYQHDLRGIKFQPGAEFGPGAEGEAVWRTHHSIKRNGELYPTHGVGPISKCLNINTGNRLETLTSTATKSRGLHNYIVAKGGDDHPNAEVRFKLGDIVTTVIKCANGETIVLSHDTNLPRPYSLNFRVQGTKGIWMSDNRSIYIEDLSPEPHTWEPLDNYAERYDHPLWTRYTRESEGAGHGGMDFFVIHAFVESVKRRVPPPIDVYEAASWSVISPLSEQSIAAGSSPMQFPDFTRGKWSKRASSFALTDEY
ncbi:MAG: Gfo/Idh/MocA family oxidoreductase [Gemmatimonadota bacterium]|nr:MAG: Gfo/Idh/MocA family oxidoreductase [Gemmatimonadota bacterium]